jgi:hypothetical protein
MHAVLGTDYHDLDSPSYYNPVEAAKIVELVEKLLTSRTIRCRMDDIGIIAGFRKQVGGAMKWAVVCWWVLAQWAVP